MLLLYTLLTTHLTILCVTIYLHRSQAHRSIILHPIVSHPMRFWLWLTTGMITKQWVAVHRKHHRYCEQEGDPHSPHVFGIWKVVFAGSFLYAQSAKDVEMVKQYGVGSPDDWVERKIYSAHPWLGIILLLLINFAIFNWYGIIAWGIQMLWIPFWAAGVVNGLGHWVGYRNGDTKDRSRNIIPIGVIIGGEELHNNHHIDPANPKLSKNWYEFDLGWFYIKILKYIKLAKIKEYYV